MKYLIILFLFPLSMGAQTDFNYQFSTNGYAEVDMSSMLNDVDTLTKLHLPVRVVKDWNNLLIISESSTVQFDGKVIFLGRSIDGDLVYDVKGGGEYWSTMRVYINPMDGTVIVRKKGKIVATYGSNPVFIPISN